jgi:hypothetical protein
MVLPMEVVMASGELLLLLLLLLEVVDGAASGSASCLLASLEAARLDDPDGASGRVVLLVTYREVMISILFVLEIDDTTAYSTIYVNADAGGTC